MRWWGIRLILEGQPLTNSQIDARWYHGIASHRTSYEEIGLILEHGVTEGKRRMTEVIYQRTLERNEALQKHGAAIVETMQSWGVSLRVAMTIMGIQ